MACPPPAHRTHACLSFPPPPRSSTLCASVRGPLLFDDPRTNGTAGRAVACAVSVVGRYVSLQLDPASSSPLALAELRVLARGERGGRCCLGVLCGASAHACAPPPPHTVARCRRLNLPNLLLA